MALVHIVGVDPAIHCQGGFAGDQVPIPLIIQKLFMLLKLLQPGVPVDVLIDRPFGGLEEQLPGIPEVAPVVQALSFVQDGAVRQPLGLA